MPETLTSRYIIKKPQAPVELEVNDAVYHTRDVFIRKIKATNNSDQPHRFLLFFCQDFHINGYDAGDTALYVPNSESVVHYKGKRYFLVGGASADKGFYQYSVGYKEVEGKEGTWRDCEDGVLSGNAVAQGAVDSAVSLNFDWRHRLRVYAITGSPPETPCMKFQPSTPNSNLSAWSRCCLKSRTTGAPG